MFFYSFILGKLQIVVYKIFKKEKTRVKGETRNVGSSKRYKISDVYISERQSRLHHLRVGYPSEILYEGGSVCDTRPLP